MRVQALLLAACLLLIAAPAQADAPAEGPTPAVAEDASCNGVVLGGQWTGHCGDLCYGEVHVMGAWFLTHYC